ncbi:MAG: zinc dependent phospholipase C family protein [Butyricicoccus porcorum]|uniref:zinc dependent phospholipase C family protein n=1 Tax=Butyricicoccus porcorum TaxID=1945634 RepID=UPI002986C187|nr:zinc dependent phospholipase C family protein [Butyricicoccus porcorum]MDY4484133.1 zinc dependent phospholipase C family protein [Butyricicoccus porcorum]
MDSVSHTTVAHYLLDYVEKTDGISFDRKAFVFGNLKPDLKGEYLTKRHYPSLMFEEVMQRIRDFASKFCISETNGAKLSEELGVICHYITDFFSFPHNDDIYEHGLFAHYVYEKRTSLTISKRIDETKFDGWVKPLLADIPQTPEALIASISEQHRSYVAQPEHSISDDVFHICRILTTVVMSMIRITCNVFADLPFGASAPIAQPA